jgi:hypothetical protein
VTLIVSSIFRDSAKYVHRYASQVESLQSLLGVPVHAIVAEGDSTDDTPHLLAKTLRNAPFEATVLTVNHGGPKFDSYDIPERWAQIALVCNAVMDKVAETITPEDRFLYVESDLVWTADDLAVLYHDLDAVDAVSPMSMLATTGMFYDTWGFVKDGREFAHNPPHHPGLIGEDRYVEIDSSGSCFALRPRLATKVRFSPVDCIRGIGRDIRAQGSTLWLDQQLGVIHP